MTARRDPPLSVRAMVALVVATYGYPAGGFRAMPWREFALLWSQLSRVRTWSTLIAAHGAAIGASMAVGGKDGGATKILESMEREVLRG